jgi:hypothetical protein
MRRGYLEWLLNQGSGLSKAGELREAYGAISVSALVKEPELSETHGKRKILHRAPIGRHKIYPIFECVWRNLVEIDISKSAFQC